MTMTDEEKQKMHDDLLPKAHGLKDEAEAATDKAKEYFNELKTKGSAAIKEHFPQAEDMLNNLFGNKNNASSTGSAPPTP